MTQDPFMVKIVGLCIGGNQRELARQKNQKKLQEVQKKKGTGDKGMTLEQRKQRDADMMREKQQKAVNKTEGPARCGRETYFFEKSAKWQGVKVGSWEGVRPREHRAFAVEAYFCNGRSIVATQRAFQLNVDVISNGSTLTDTRDELQHKLQHQSTRPLSNWHNLLSGAFNRLSARDSIRGQPEMIEVPCGQTKLSLPPLGQPGIF
uniref:Small EDRK-rich factor-like N-terminal domain-containing protein n=1 Tax=Timema shepardi TaxID=629360 RepID=A0A7R9AXC0_TIMSH|nr:unnamed protein product [Timema shepardi]